MEDHSLRPLKDKLAALLAPLASQAHGRAPTHAEIELQKLHGDASNRIYYRVTSPLGHFILMRRPVGSLESPSEELTKEKSADKEYSFLNIHRYLEKNGLRVPKIFGVSQDQELILLEDLGNFVLEKKLHESPAQTRALYEKALALLMSWQQLKQSANEPCVAWRRSFDPDLFNWEFEHFIEWGIEKSQNTHVSPADLTALRGIFKDLSQELFEFDKCLCHRDFQSRNIMLNDDELVLLDFQDALVGPRCYDLVALLRDSYISLKEEDLVYLQQKYLNQAGVNDAAAFMRAFDVQTVQRKLKDGGRFHYINLFKGNPSFLPHVPNSFRYAHRALQRIPEGKHLLPILAKYLKEFSS